MNYERKVPEEEEECFMLFSFSVWAINDRERVYGNNRRKRLIDVWNNRAEGKHPGGNLFVWSVIVYGTLLFRRKIAKQQLILKEEWFLRLQWISLKVQLIMREKERKRRFTEEMMDEGQKNSICHHEEFLWERVSFLINFETELVFKMKTRHPDLFWDPLRQ